MERGDIVVDGSGTYGQVERIWPNTGQVQVRQRPGVTCTYDSKNQLKFVMPGENVYEIDGYRFIDVVSVVGDIMLIDRVVEIPARAEKIEFNMKLVGDK
jgi:hypothetical protein